MTRTDSSTRRRRVRIPKRVAQVLVPGESVLASTRGLLDSNLDALGEAVTSSARFVATGVPSVGRPAGKRRGVSLETYLCLTDRRLMVWSTAWHGGPTVLEASVPVEEIRDVTVKTVKVFWTLPRIAVKITDGGTVRWTSAKVHARRATKVADALRALLDGREI